MDSQDKAHRGALMLKHVVFLALGHHCHHQALDHASIHVKSAGLFAMHDKRNAPGLTLIHLCGVFVSNQSKY